MLIGSAVGFASGRWPTRARSTRLSRRWARSRAASRLGRTALPAVVSAVNPEVIGVAVSDLGGTVLRRSVPDVGADRRGGGRGA